MRSDAVISVNKLTKTYRIFGHPGDRIKQALTFGRMRFHREFTALKDVSFEIKKGETIGIIGRNGSGKSTLLQLICGILKATAGSVQVNGRIVALLELGAGFNPEFTGTENVYFQGALMGFTRAQMDERFDGIADFAEIGEFIDQPVRTYSSGMFVRLAFSTAMHLNPEILVVDEALAVGDAGFQQKCFRQD
jgi:ABC-type polysaccharide/polyol phosphate transport system ATPase subunit